MKVVQVGIGGMGNAWLNAVKRSQHVEFAGFVEINDEIAHLQAEAHNLDKNRIFRSLPQALDALDVESIIIVTPPQFHKDVSFIALEAGIPVLCEKPLAGTIEDSRAIVAKADETGVLHMVTQNYRYTALAQTVKSILDSGKLGEVGSVDVSFYKGPHFGGFREEMPHPLIIDMSIHHLDMMRFFLNSNPQEIVARSWNPSWSWYDGDASASANILFDNDICATYVGSWCSQAMETTWNANWRFECEKGILTIEDDIVYIQKLIGIEDGTGFRRNIHEPKQVVDKVTMQREAQDYLLHEFYEAVTQGKPTGTPAQDNIHTIEFVFGLVESCDTGEIIRFS